MSLSAMELLLRLVASAVLGGAIGYERERREQPAGLRTHLLVALASATFMLVSTQFEFHQHYAINNAIRADVSRIASNVVVGIGFLGGGAILRAGLQIKGLTTAASLWLVAALGLAAGAGMYLLAMMATGLSLFALVVLRSLERSFKNIHHLRVRLEFDGPAPSRAQIEQALGELRLEVKDAAFTLDRVRNRSSVSFEISLRRYDLEARLQTLLEGLPSVRVIAVKPGGA